MELSGVMAMQRVAKRSVFVLVALVLSAMLSACGSGSSSRDEEDEGSDPPEVLQQEVTITFNLRRANGQPVTGADEITSQVFNVVSHSLNQYGQLVVVLEESTARGTLRLKKSGFVDALVDVDQAVINQTKAVTLMPQGPAIVFDAFAGGTLLAQDGASVDLPEQALQYPDGTPASGDVNLYVTVVDVQDEAQLEAFPGGYYGDADSEAELVMLNSYGLVEMTFERDGEELQLREGFSAQLSVPLYVDKHIDGSDIEVGDTIPFWILNETSGVWVQEGEGVVQAEPLAPYGLVMQVSTSHFSWFNADAWAVPGFNQRCVVDVDIVGLEQSEPYTLTVSRKLPGLPVASLTSNYKFDGLDLNASLPVGANYKFTAKNETGATDEKTVGCANTNTITTQLTLGEPTTAPEFVSWSVKATPTFTRENENAPYEIKENVVTFGGLGRWDEDDLIEVSGDLVLQTGLFPNGSYTDVVYQEVFPSPTVITAKLANKNGETEAVSVVEFVEESSPLVESLRIYKIESEVTIAWTVEGADEMTLFAVPAADPLEIGVKVNLGEIDPDTGFYKTNVLADYEGYLRVVFTNQYGSTELYTLIVDNSFCIPNSDIPCGPF